MDDHEKILIGELARDLGLKIFTPDLDLEVEITDSDVNRPALQLAGFYNYFQNSRVQIMGNVECAYLDSLDEETRAKRMNDLFAKKVPCVIYCRNRVPSKQTLEQAIKYGACIFGTSEGTSETSEKVIHYLKKRMAPVITIHGVLIDVFGEGVLITGESGIGKSEAALELVKRGHRLVADDAVEIHKVDDTTLIGCASPITKDFVELRGVGVIDVKSLFGLESVKNEQQIDFVINVEDWNKEREYDRLGNADEYVEYLGNKVLRYSLPLRPGRNLAVIVEAVAVNYRQRTLGYNAVDELYRRVRENMQNKRKK